MRKHCFGIRSLHNKEYTKGEYLIEEKVIINYGIIIFNRFYIRYKIDSYKWN